MMSLEKTYESLTKRTFINNITVIPAYSEVDLWSDIRWDSISEIAEPVCKHELSGRYTKSGFEPDLNVMIISKLQSLEDKLEAHDIKAATFDQVVQHDQHVVNELTIRNATLIEAVNELHKELASSSLRHRLFVYTSVAVLINTLLTGAAIFWGGVTISAEVMGIILPASILFWMLARLVPRVTPLAGDTKHA